MSAVSSKRVANLTMITLQNMRSDQCFELFYSSILVKAKQHSFIGEPSLLRKRRCPTRFEEGTGPPFSRILHKNITEECILKPLTLS